MSQERRSPEEQERIERERANNAKGGFFYNAAVWLLGRFPLTKHRYRNWTRGRRILVGWLLWLVCLPIIPAVAIALWYFNDPEGFKQSPWAKGLIGLFVVWAGAFGFIATNQFQPDQDGLYSVTQTKQQKTDKDKIKSDLAKPDAQKTLDAKKKKDEVKLKKTPADADGEKDVVNADPAAIASDEAKRKIKDQKESKPTRGRQFANCTEAFEAGVFNIVRKDPSYQEKLDRDDDGIACEK